MKFKCFDIKWDTDRRGNCGLPSEMIIELDTEELLGTNNGIKDETFFNNLEEDLVNKLSDKSGFCVLDFNYEEIKSNNQHSITMKYDTFCSELTSHFTALQELFKTLECPKDVDNEQFNTSIRFAIEECLKLKSTLIDEFGEYLDD